MFKYFTILFYTGLFVCPNVSAQTSIQTSFETAPAPAYAIGNLNGQNNWTVTINTTSPNNIIGTAVVSTAKAHTGTRSINLNANNAGIKVDYVGYSGSVPGLTGDVYTDLWFNPASFTTRGISLNGTDLYGSSSRRIYVIEFTPDNKILAWNGSSASAAVQVGSWAANTWVRVSVKISFDATPAPIYKVAVNGVVNATDFVFREAYVPTASGTRAANIRELHSLRFNHLADNNFATSDVAIDDVYMGTTPISGVPFTTSTTRTISVNQPEYGTISLEPNQPTYPLGSTVTATLTLPGGYTNSGWTGDLSGTELVKTITVNDNKTIGATVIVDAANPPPKFRLTITPPVNGTITVTPAAPDSLYYKEAKIIAKVTPGVCYEFANWTGDISGPAPDTFRIQNDMTIGAIFSLSTTASVKRTVSTVAEFKAALLILNPGDTIEVNNGTYDLSSLSITRGGCDLRPVTIMAKNAGQVILNGATALVFKNLKHVTFKGFSFQSANIGTGIKLENCSKMRITGNSFAITENASCTWITIGDTFGSTDSLKSGYNRVDHNIFDGKIQVGNYVRMDGNINQQSRYDTIDHNWFKNNGPRADNGQECIRVGVSTLSNSSGFTLIEYNLFQDCDGDPEIVSIKSNDNIIRYNTFQRCLGTLCLRQGNRSVAEGNYFFGEGKIIGTNGTGGIRAYGKGHKIINNYFNGLTGTRFDAAITITNGDVDNNSTDNSAHHIPEDVIIAFNTLAYNKANFELGFPNGTSYPLAPVNCTIANNIATDSLNPIIKSYSSTSLAGFNFSNNIIYPTGTASVGIAATPAQVTNTNPLLVKPNCNGTNCSSSMANKVFRLSQPSPAVNAATGSYTDVIYDFEKVVRPVAKDIGAHEFTGDRLATTGALSPENVGPTAIDYSYSYSYATVVPVHLFNFSARYADNKTFLQWQADNEINVLRYEIEWSTDKIRFTKIDVVPANASLNYHAEHIPPAAGKNYYRIKIIDVSGSLSYSEVRMINKTENFSVAVNPNPAKQFINAEISGKPANDAKIRLINSGGASVRLINVVKAGLNVISVENLPAGVYRLQVVQSGVPTVVCSVTVIK